jgi:hypothetical protein
MGGGAGTSGKAPTGNARYIGAAPTGRRGAEFSCALELGLLDAGLEGSGYEAEERDSAGLAHLRLEGGWVNADDELPFRDRGVVVCEELLDGPRDLCAHWDGVDRIEDPSGRHRGPEVPKGQRTVEK